MKNFLLMLALLPLTATGQTVRQKVLYMNVTRTSGSITARLEGGEDFLGPIYNRETKRLFINGASRSLSTIKEIRFEIREEEVTPEEVAVEGIETDNAPKATFDLGGRRVDERSMQRGMYIRGNKKIVKK